MEPFKAFLSLIPHDSICVKGVESGLVVLQTDLPIRLSLSKVNGSLVVKVFRDDFKD